MSIPNPQSIAAAVHGYLQDTVTTEAERARVLLEIVRQFYNFTKFSAPGGQGADGKDGPERRGIGDVVEAAGRHQMAAAQRTQQQKPTDPPGRPHAEAQAGLLLSDQRGNLQLMASSSEETKLLDLFQLHADEGPCVECYRTGAQVAVADLAQVAERWPRFVPAALGHDYRAVHAFPLRLRHDVIGAMNLFNTVPGELPESDRHVAQALADTAAIGIIQERAIVRGEIVVEQLEGALRSRVVIEQAKGVLAERGNLPMDTAFTLLRTHARNTGTRLTELAHQVVTGTIDTDALLANPAPTDSAKAVIGSPAPRAEGCSIWQVKPPIAHAAMP